MAVSLFCTANILNSYPGTINGAFSRRYNMYKVACTETIEMIRLRFISHMYIYINPAPGLYCVYCCHAAVKHRKVRKTTGKKAERHM